MGGPRPAAGRWLEAARERRPIGLRATESGLQENFRRIAATASAVPILVGQYIHPDPLVRVFSYAFPQTPK